MVRTLPRFPSLTLPTSPLPPRRNIPDRAGPPTPAAPPPLRLGAALPLTWLLPPPGRPRPPAGERLFRFPSRLSLAAGASPSLLCRPRSPAGSPPPPSAALAALVGLGPSPAPSHLAPTRPSPPSGDSRAPGCASSVPQRHHRPPEPFRNETPAISAALPCGGCFAAPRGSPPAPGAAAVALCCSCADRKAEVHVAQWAG